MKGTQLIGLAVAVGAAVIGINCGDDAPTNPATGGAGGEATTTTTGPNMTTSSNVSTTSGMMMPMDESTSCADAVALESATNTLGGTFYDYDAVIGDPGDTDFFTFQATAGEWVRVTTSTETTSEINAVVTLYDADGGVQLAQNNNAIGVTGFDSEIAYLVPTTGTYCVKVEDFSTFSGGTPAGGPTFAYRAVMVPVDFALYDFYNQDIEPNDDTLTPQTGLSFDIGNTQQLRTDFAGVLSATTDVDVYQWQAPLGGLAFNLYFTPDGSNGFGSTQDPGIIRVYEEDGVTVLAELDVQKGSQRLASVPIVAGNDYFFEVNWPAGAASGANDFYYLKFRTLDTVNAQELDEAGNDVATGAEIAPPTLDGTTTRHFIGGSIAAPDDDWWSFQANAGDTVVLVCSAWRAGAGVRDATFSIHADPAMAALETETEVETENINWSDTSSSASKGAVNITTTGTHYLHIASTLQDPNVTSGHYLCGIHVFP